VTHGRSARRRTFIAVVLTGTLAAPALATAAGRSHEEVLPPHAVDRSALTYTYVKGTFEPEFDPPAPGTYTLPVIDRVRDHSLLDTSGARVGILDLKKDRLAVIAFIYTTCGEATGCPLAMAVLARLDLLMADDLELREKVALFAVSFDPERDTPQRMAEVRGGFAPRSEWHFLTAATQREIQPLLDDFNQPVHKLRYPDGKWSGLFRHVLKVFLLDESDRVRNIYSVGFLSPQLVLNDLRTLAMETRTPITGIGAATDRDARHPRPE
jgi:cytochrome oxidase Cu insertion factor (SCO1/SenC/PrrC family)